jgi:hypothetical protein
MPENNQLRPVKVRMSFNLETPVIITDGAFLVLHAGEHQIQVHVRDGQAVVCVVDKSIVKTFEEAGY